MARFLSTAVLGAALVFGFAPGLAANVGALDSVEILKPSLAEQLRTSSGEARGQVLQDVLRLATVKPDELDEASLIPVLFDIASSDGNPQFRTTAAQVIAMIGSRADGRRLARIARRDPSPEASRLMQLAAASTARR